MFKKNNKLNKIITSLIMILFTQNIFGMESSYSIITLEQMDNFSYNEKLDLTTNQLDGLETEVMHNASDLFNHVPVTKISINCIEKFNLKNINQLANNSTFYQLNLNQYNALSTLMNNNAINPSIEFLEKFKILKDLLQKKQEYNRLNNLSKKKVQLMFRAKIEQIDPNELINLVVFISNLSPEQIPFLTIEHFKQLSSCILKSFSKQQIQAIPKEKIQYITPKEFPNEIEFIVELSPEQIDQLSPNIIKQFNKNIIKNIGTLIITQSKNLFKNLTAQQFSWFNSKEIKDFDNKEGLDNVYPYINIEHLNELDKEQLNAINFNRKPELIKEILDECLFSELYTNTIKNIDKNIYIQHITIEHLKELNQQQFNAINFNQKPELIKEILDKGLFSKLYPDTIENIDTTYITIEHLKELNEEQLNSINFRQKPELIKEILDKGLFFKLYPNTIKNIDISNIDKTIFNKCLNKQLLFFSDSQMDLFSKDQQMNFNERITNYLRSLSFKDLNNFSPEEVKSFRVYHIKLILDEILHKTSDFVPKLLAEQIDGELIQNFNQDHIDQISNKQLCFFTEIQMKFFSRDQQIKLKERINNYLTKILTHESFNHFPKKEVRSLSPYSLGLIIQKNIKKFHSTSNFVQKLLPKQIDGEILSYFCTDNLKQLPVKTVRELDIIIILKNITPERIQQSELVLKLSTSQMKSILKRLFYPELKKNKYQLIIVLKEIIKELSSCYDEFHSSCQWKKWYSNNNQTNQLEQDQLPDQLITNSEHKKKLKEEYHKKYKTNYQLSEKEIIEFSETITKYEQDNQLIKGEINNLDESEYFFNKILTVEEFKNFTPKEIKDFDNKEGIANVYPYINIEHLKELDQKQLNAINFNIKPELIQYIIDKVLLYQLNPNQIKYIKISSIDQINLNQCLDKQLLFFSDSQMDLFSENQKINCKDRINNYLKKVTHQDLDDFITEEVQAITVNNIKLILDEILHKTSDFVPKLLAQQIDEEVIKKFNNDNFNQITDKQLCYFTDIQMKLFTENQKIEFQKRIENYLKNKLIVVQDLDNLTEDQIRSLTKDTIRFMLENKEYIFHNASNFISHLLPKQIDGYIIRRFSTQNLNNLNIQTMRELDVKIILNISGSRLTNLKKQQLITFFFLKLSRIQIQSIFEMFKKSQKGDLKQKCGFILNAIIKKLSSYYDDFHSPFQWKIWYSNNNKTPQLDKDQLTDQWITNIEHRNKLKEEYLKEYKTTYQLSEQEIIHYSETINK